MFDSVREWRFYVDDMIAFAEKVLAYTAGMDQTAFVASTLVVSPTDPHFTARFLPHPLTADCV